jgi:ATP synthase protein I
MKKESLRYIREMAYYGSIGLQVAFSIIIGYFVGDYLDNKVFHTTPWLTYIGLGMGIAAGFRNLGMAIKRIQKFNE